MVLKRNMIYAICRDGKSNDIKIFYDLGGKCKDVEFKNIRLSNGLIVSAEVCGGRVKYLEIRNTSQENITKIIDVNPLYKGIKKHAIIINGLSMVTLE